MWLHIAQGAAVQAGSFLKPDYLPRQPLAGEMKNQLNSFPDAKRVSPKEVANTTYLVPTTLSTGAVEKPCRHSE